MKASTAKTAPAIDQPTARVKSIDGSSRQLKQERGVETQEKLISAAIDLLGAEGYSNFSTPAVAKHAGVSRGALQYHFESREALLVAVRTRLAHMMQERAAPTELSNLSLAERVARMVDYYWDVIGSQAYVAAIEIRMYERFNTDLHQQSMQELGKIARIRDRSWIQVFADSPLSVEELVVVRRFMLDVMRGMAIRRIETGRDTVMDRELALLRNALVREIAPV